MSQRRYPKMAMVKPSIQGEFIVLSASDKADTVKFPIDARKCNGNKIQCKYV